MKHILLLVCFFSFHFSLSAQSHPPKYEFRAVWLATVANIDWPSQPGLPVEEQKAEAREILDMHQQLGMNVLIFQVRPAADAFYSSELEPWSRYLTGVQGKAPEPFYDPLKFWIEECHKRGMELHAWMNPFRVALNSGDLLSADHVVFRHPEWVIKYGNSLYFDPGLPGARSFLVKVVRDVVSEYDVDGIHFDDYFYPYPIGEEFPDTASFSFYNRGFFPEHKAAWRRENVDIIIKMLNDTIKAVKPWVKFGISPFGVWRNKGDDPAGSDTRAGITNYDHLYANILKWQKNGWIDYTIPQLYWYTGHPLVDFKTLACWWKKHAYGRGMFIGHGVYKSNASPDIPQWRKPSELPAQVRLTRKIPEIGGSAFYSSKHFKRELLGFQDSLAFNLYQYPALVPPMPWLDDRPPGVEIKLKKRWWRRIKWEVTSLKTNESVEEEMAGCIIYLNEAGTPFDPDNPEFIYTLTPKGQRKWKFSGINRKKRTYEVRVSVRDRLNNESEQSAPVVIKL